MILAGGLGTRLASVVSEVPKPMAHVAGRPFLEYLIDQACAAGISDIVLCVGHKAHVIEDHFKDGRQYGVTIRYSKEEQPLGTGGALALAAPLIRSDPFLVFNGDSYCPTNLEALFVHHRTTGAAATIVAAQVEDAARFGSLNLGAEDQVVHFQEKSQSKGAGYVNAGIYLLSKAVLDLIPAGQPCSIEHEVFPSLTGSRVYAFIHPGSFIDIGTPTALEMAQTSLPLLVEAVQQERNMLRDRIVQSLRTGAEVRLATLEACENELLRCAELITAGLERGGKLLFFGNGGSAADAQHLAAEFVGRFEFNREPLAALALTTDTSALTAIANDFGFEQVFARQIRALGRPGDIAIAISTSGNSANVLRGVEAAHDSGIVTIGLTGGDGGQLARMTDYAIIVPSSNTAHIQETHIAIGHALCAVVEYVLVEPTK